MTQKSTWLKCSVSLTSCKKRILDNDVSALSNIHCPILCKAILHIGYSNIPCIYIYHKGQAPVVYSNDSFNGIRVLYLKFKTYH